ncbi:MAG: di-trans,poly-cis-decaprenylcistransferase [Deltaproteobacteria bacterium]|nr:MAG: di-trans,poly-cis-decaprenylcistransferase [Deltaproteobacteria bacterium]
MRVVLDGRCLLVASRTLRRSSPLPRLPFTQPSRQFPARCESAVLQSPAPEGRRGATLRTELELAKLRGEVSRRPLERREILDNGIRLHAIGELDRLPARVGDPLEELRTASAEGKDMVLTLALSYGGREEIIAMARKVAEDARRGSLEPDEIDAAAVEDRLWTRGLPPLELVVRTSGEVRVSNFLLWQLAYAEIHLTETLWPDFGEEDLLVALDDFQNRERRFGKTSAQVRTTR